MCFLQTQKNFSSTKIRKAGVMNQLFTIHHLNLSTYRIQLRGASFEIVCMFSATKTQIFLYNSKLCSYGSEKHFKNGHHPRPLIRSKLGLPWGTPWWCWRVFRAFDGGDWLCMNVLHARAVPTAGSPRSAAGPNLTRFFAVDSSDSSESWWCNNPHFLLFRILILYTY